MTYDLVIRATHAVLPHGTMPAAVAIADGAIAAIGAEDEPFAAHAEVELPHGQVLIPGAVDTHVHINEPGRTEWEGFDSATRAARAGGVTTVIDMPLNSIPPTVSPAALETKKAAAFGKTHVNVGFWGGAVPENLGSLEALWDEGVFGFKCFLAPSGVDEFGHLDRARLRAAMQEIAGFGGRLIVHAEDPEVLDDAPPPAGADYAPFVASRPDSAETSAIDAVIDGVRATGVRAHILHLSSAAALPAIRAAKAEGLPLTVETCPHYLTFDAEHIPAGGTQYKCCPPIRSAENRERLWEALAQGTIDFVASDHSPATADLKLAGGGDFGVAWGGIAGLQVSLAAVWTGARARGYRLDDAVAWMSGRPAAWAGLQRKGAIQVGRDADLVAFDPEAPFEVHAAELAHKNPVSAFDGHALVGRAARVWLAGSESGEGEQLRRP
ncbi:allantoinase AllB [Demequina lignilytica]|uniref:allantoinase n=1 Tax=Demequina lignilytica TaxID=3051663 RepID=A0AB35MJW7_9MICO|nr:MULTISPECIES: allantoinase AllB [unclassified Demequina]MDN4484086.1 allantoinase AllB [Demequina sp. SYSU T0a273]MDN4490331.1 allantoinase AllB [Demequina sp. SYSU T00068]